MFVTGGKPEAKIELDDGVSFFRIHQESSLMCVILEDFSISILDYEVRKVGTCRTCDFPHNALYVLCSTNFHNFRW